MNVCTRTPPVIRNIRWPRSAPSALPGGDNRSSRLQARTVLHPLRRQHKSNGR